MLQVFNGCFHDFHGATCFLGLMIPGNCCVRLVLLAGKVRLGMLDFVFVGVMFVFGLTEERLRDYDSFFCLEF